MATLAIGDVHGNLRALDDLLGRVRGEIAAGDVVVFLGDYIDRGPDSRGCIDAILAFRRECPAETVCLLGNHEEWLLRTMADYSRHSWLLGMAPFETIRSYSAAAEQTLRKAIKEAGLGPYLGRRSLPYDAFFDAMPVAHRTFFGELALWFESPDCFCSHAGLEPREPGLGRQSRKALIWGDGAFPEEYAGDPIVVYGHRNNAEIDSYG